MSFYNKLYLPSLHIVLLYHIQKKVQNFDDVNNLAHVAKEKCMNYLQTTPLKRHSHEKSASATFLESLFSVQQKTFGTRN